MLGVDQVAAVPLRLGHAGPRATIHRDTGPCETEAHDAATSPERRLWILDPTHDDVDGRLGGGMGSRSRRSPRTIAVTLRRLPAFGMRTLSPFTMLAPADDLESAQSTRVPVPSSPTNLRWGSISQPSGWFRAAISNVTSQRPLRPSSPR